MFFDEAAFDELAQSAQDRGSRHRDRAGDFIKMCSLFAAMRREMKQDFDLAFREKSRKPLSGFPRWSFLVAHESRR